MTKARMMTLPNGERGEVTSEARFCSLSGEVVPARLSAKWITEVAERHGVSRFTVTTVRRVVWSPTWVMTTYHEGWEKVHELIVGTHGAGVYSTTTKMTP